MDVLCTGGGGPHWWEYVKFWPGGLGLRACVAITDWLASWDSSNSRRNELEELWMRETRESQAGVMPRHVVILFQHCCCV